MKIKTLKREAIKDYILNWGKKHNLSQGERLLSEKAFSEKIGASPLTINRAMVELEHEKKIHRIKGKGSFWGPGAKLSINNIALILPKPDLNTFEANPNSYHLISSALNSLSQSSIDSFSIEIIPENTINADIFKRLSSYSCLFFFVIQPYKDLINWAKTKGQTPVVTLNQYVATKGILNVTVDREASVQLALEHLVKFHGCKKIGFIGIKEELSPKLTGYRKFLQNRKLEINPDFEITDAYNQDSGYNSAKAWLAKGNLENCDSLLVDTDLKALGVLECFAEEGIKVPQDLKLISYDGLEPYQIAPPYLTAIKTPFKDLIHLALNQIKQNNWKQSVTTNIEVIAKLKLGKTCGCK